MRRWDVLGQQVLLAAAALALFLSVIPSAYSRVRPPGFPIPPTMRVLGEAVTPGEYAELDSAIRTWEASQARTLEEGEGLGDFSRIEATRVNLGALGQGFVVSFGNHAPPCGATGNCPMALFVRGANGYREAISCGGWGYALLPSGGPVPDVAFYWNMSAAESDAQVFHYAHGQFGAISRAVCTANHSSNPICAPVGNTAHTPQGALSPAEYNVLRSAVEGSSRQQSIALAGGSSFNDAHAVGVFGMQFVSAVAIETGPCGAHRNCNISIYAQHYRDDTYWPLLRNVSGWGVAPGILVGPAPTHVAFVIARHLSANQDLLTRYVTPLAVTNHHGDLTHNSRLFPDACEIVTPKTGHWPARWNAAALIEKPVSCSTAATPVTSQTQTLAADSTNISAIAQDGDGTVWAVGGGRSGQLYRWHDGGWVDVPTPVPVSATSPQQLEFLRANGYVPQPMGLWSGPNGGVLVDWLDPTTQKLELFWQRGEQKKLLATVPPISQGSHLDIETIVPTGSGAIVITGDQRGWRNGVPVSGQPAGIFHLSDRGQLERIYTFSSDQYLRYRTPPGRIPYFVPLHAIGVGEGKVWLWCGWSTLGPPPGDVLAGFLVTDGKTVQYYRRLPGLPSLHLTSVDAWDANHLAIATFGAGLYTVDTRSLEVRPVDEPEPGAFRFVKRVFRAGSELYVVTFGPEFSNRMRPGVRSLLTGAIWRWRDGHWDEAAKDAADTSEAGLATAQGLWLGTSDFRGLWFVPASGPARRIDWRQGLPTSTVRQLFELAGGDILASDAGSYAETRSVEFSPGTMLKQPPGSEPLPVIYPVTHLEPDRNQHVWGMLTQHTLDDWDGSRWISHPLPPELHDSGFTGLDLDTAGRVWLFPNCRMQPTGFFDPAENRWSTYQDYPMALSHQPQPVAFLHAADDRVRPIYGPHSQIVFVGPCAGVNYFDGAAWHLWNRPQLPPNRDISIPPFFDSEGHLALDIRHVVWQWDAEGGWQRTSEAPPENYARLLPDPFAPLPPPPAGCATTSPSSLVYDTQGRAWWVAGDALYEGVTDQCRKVLSGVSPFIDGRRLSRVLLGARGTVFLETQLPFSYVVLQRSTITEFGADGAPQR